MAQIQFRSDDTTPWGQGFGNSSDGVLTIASNTTDSPTVTTFTGSSGAYSGTLGSGSGFAAGQIVIIHQSQGTGVGTWQLNYIISVVSTTVTFLYPLVATFGTGCQIMVVKQYSNVTINSGQIFTGSLWNGSTGGITVLLASGSITATGTINTQTGYRGGTGETNPVEGIQGEGQTAGQGSTGSANGVGGGGGGGGGQGQGGGTSSDLADLTNAWFGGGGGGTDTAGGHTPQNGGAGGGFCLLIAPTITVTGAINLNGVTPTLSDSYSASGSGAGGSLLLKGQNIVLGSSLCTAIGGSAQNSGNSLAGQNGGGGGHSTGGNTASNGSSGYGGTGRIHADYGSSISGTTNPSIDSRQDSSLVNKNYGSML